MDETGLLSKQARSSHKLTFLKADPPWQQTSSSFSLPPFAVHSAFPLPPLPAILNRFTRVAQYPMNQLCSLPRPSTGERRSPPSTYSFAAPPQSVGKEPNSSMLPGNGDSTPENVAEGVLGKRPPTAPTSVTPSLMAGHSPDQPTIVASLDNSPALFQFPPARSWSFPHPQSHQYSQDSLHFQYPQESAQPRRQTTLAQDEPFAYSSTLLAPLDGTGLGLGDLHQSRRWSLSAEMTQAHPPTVEQQRPWTSSNVSSSAHYPSHFAQSSSSTLNANLPPTTSSTIVSGSPFNDYSAPNTGHGRPSTTSSFSSATPLHDHKYQLDTNGATGMGSSFGAGDLDSTNSHSHLTLQQATPPGAGNTFVEDSNPFYFQRQLQTLHEQEPLLFHPHHSEHGGSILTRPVTMGAQHTQAPAMYQPPRSAGNPQLSRRFSEDSHFYDYSTPPATAASATSSVYYDQYSAPSTGIPLQDLLALDQHASSTPPSTAGSTQHFSQRQDLRRQSSYQMDQHQSSQYSTAFQGRHQPHAYHPRTPTHSQSQVHHQSSSTSPPSTAGGSSAPSPYSLIVPNPDPATAASRPHLCTHCQETFRRIHDAKRHAFGALGVKNYACMGGCGMTFKRSEGRSRHWMREEVAGVGSSMPIPGVTVGPGGAPIWGGKGCEERHAQMMSGTMEEDRRLRNKARRERIMVMQAKSSGGGMAEFSAGAAATAAALGLTTRTGKNSMRTIAGSSASADAGGTSSGRNASRVGYSPY